MKKADLLKSLYKTQGLQGDPNLDDAISTVIKDAVENSDDIIAASNVIDYAIKQLKRASNYLSSLNEDENLEN